VNYLLDTNAVVALLLPELVGSPTGSIGTQHDDTPLIVEDDVNNQALAMLAKGTCAHVRIGPLPVI
jgi:hypothetical protein